MKKSIAAIVLTGLLFSLTSCLPEFPDLMVSTEEYQEKTKALLEEKYGEKFEIVCSAGDEATAYPVANPDLLFTARRFSKSNEVDDDYIQEIVGLQYKKLAEDVLKDFKYDYYLDVDLGFTHVDGDLEFTYEPIDAKQDVTIEELDKEYLKKVEPNYNWYISKEALELSYEELYQWINNVATISEQENSLVCMFFINDTVMHEVMENYKNYSYQEAGFYDYLINNSVRPQQHMVDNELKIDFNRFTELMNGEYLKK